MKHADFPNDFLLLWILEDNKVQKHEIALSARIRVQTHSSDTLLMPPLFCVHLYIDNCAIPRAELGEWRQVRAVSNTVGSLVFLYYFVKIPFSFM